MLVSSPKSSSRRRPLAKCSMMAYNSLGLSVAPYGGSSESITSVSTFAWMMWPS